MLPRKFTCDRPVLGAHTNSYKIGQNTTVLRLGFTHKKHHFHSILSGWSVSCQMCIYSNGCRLLIQEKNSTYTFLPRPPSNLTSRPLCRTLHADHRHDQSLFTEILTKCYLMQLHTAKHPTSKYLYSKYCRRSRLPKILFRLNKTLHNTPNKESDEITRYRILHNGIYLLIQ